MPQLIPHYLNNALSDNKSHMVFSASVPKHLGCVFFAILLNCTKFQSKFTLLNENGW